MVPPVRSSPPRPWRTSPPATHKIEKLANPITDSSGDPVTLDDNPAHVAGFLYEVSRYFQREGLHSALIRYGAVVLNNGTTAVSKLNQIPFVLQSITYASSQGLRFGADTLLEHLF